MAPKIEKKNSHGLTIKQQLFCEAYLATRNGVESARRAGYKGSLDVHNGVARENLQKPLIKKYIEKRLNPKFKSAILSANQVLEEIGKIAGAPWQEFFEYQTDDGGTVKIKVQLRDKIKALDMAAKYHGIYQADRANDADLERILSAARAYLRDHPDADASEVARVFAEGRRVPVEKVQELLGRPN